jgi:hypothetical protein
MRRWGFILVLVAPAGVLFAVWPQGAHDEHVDEAAVGAGGMTSEAAAPQVSSRRGGGVSGMVMREGQPVGRARITLKAAGPIWTLSDAEGRFLLDDVPGGPLYLSASNQDGASAVMGPFEVEPGETRDVVLVLEPPVRVEGVVVDLLSRSPIAGATVVTSHQTSKTDSSGRFRLAAAAGPTWIDVVSVGYLTRSEWIVLERSLGGGRLEVVLTPSSRLSGKVSESGAPVGGATVWAEQLEGGSRGTRTITVFTGKDGRFELEGPSGLLRMWAVTPRGARITGPLLRLAVGEDREGLELVADQVSPVAGVVTRDGQPLAGAGLTAIDAASEAVAGAATSGADGRFTFSSLINGRYLLQVRRGEFAAMAGPFEHRGDGQGWQVAVSGGSVLEGRVEPPAAGVRVRWRSGEWPGPVAETTTDVSGHFRFEGLPRELVALDAEGPQGSATARARPGDEVVLRLGKGQLVVRLLDDRGQPVTDGVLLARSLDTGTVLRQLVLAPGGLTKMDLSEGTWELTLEASGRGRSGTARVEMGRSALEVTLSLEPAVSVRGTVRDADTRLPISGAQIDAVSGGDLSPFRLSVVTDARGEFSLPQTPRTARLSARHPGFKSAARMAGEGEFWDVVLARSSEPAHDEPAFQFEGVGMVLDNRSGAVLVVAVNEGGPAERAGVLKGDQIGAVDGTPTAGLPLEQVVTRIRGPAGTPVQLQLMRGGHEFVLTVRRRLLAL